MWRFREMLYFLGQELVSRTSQNAWLGRWLLPIRSTAGIAVQVVVFGGILGAPSDGIPYFVFLATGIAVWLLLRMAWYLGTRSLDIQKKYIRRIYFPRIVAVLATLWPAFLRVGIHLGILAVGLGYFWGHDGVMYLQFGLGLLEALAGIVAICLIAMSLSLFTSIYAAHARDPRFLVRFALGFWQYASPVIYPLSAVPPKAESALQFNPMTAPLEMVREGLYGAGTVRLSGVLVTAGFILVVGYLGLRFFTRSEVLALDYL